MNNSLSLVLAFAAGVLLGAFFFGGLWWTVNKGLLSKQPALWFFGSMLLRTCVVVLGFYFILGDDWKKLLAGLLGFIVARLAVTRLTRTVQQRNPLVAEAGHAP
jgi:F1F0 ATPase subunit 2